jgi:hypothetical protein
VHLGLDPGPTGESRSQGAHETAQDLDKDEAEQQREETEKKVIAAHAHSRREHLIQRLYLQWVDS